MILFMLFLGQFTRCIASNETFAAVLPSFYIKTVCWRPWNPKRLKPGSGVESFETATFFPAVQTGKQGACECSDDTNANTSTSPGILL